MAPRASVLALALACLALVQVTNAVLVPLEVLILTTPGFPGIDFLESVLLGYGTPYTVVRVAPDAAPRPDYQALLYKPDGSPRFGGIVMYPNVEAMGHLTRAEVEAVWAFQRRAGARSVKWGAWPSNVGFVPDVAACSSAPAPMALLRAAPLTISGIKRAARLDAGGLYRRAAAAAAAAALCLGCPGLAEQPLGACGMWAADFSDIGIIQGCSAVPVMNISATHVGAALVTYEDGRESLAFMHDCGGWSTSCLALGHLAAGWLLQGALPGLRQALLSVQMDDVFLTTEFEAGETARGRSSYRLTPDDLAAHATWQREMNDRFPPGSFFSFFRLDLPYNGNGVLDTVAEGTTVAVAVDDRSCLAFDEYSALGCSCWFIGTAACPASQPDFWCGTRGDWRKPLGFGTNRVPAGAADAKAGWSLAAMTARDPLAAAVVADAGGAATEFFWSHHTFTHQNLDNATSYDAAQQIGLNIDIAAAEFLNLAARPGFSSHCMVTPQISGLRNGDALAALTAAGVTCGTGDNTWPFFLSPVSPHHMLYSTLAANGHDGFAILPRFATQVYYNSSTAGQNSRLYNRLYQSYFGAPSSIADIMRREAQRVVREGLLKLRKDPYMMHQANLARFDGISLLQRWTQQVAAEFNRFATWPVTSLKLDDLKAAFEDRQARDACALSYALDVSPTGAVDGVVVTSAAPPGGTCAAPLLLPGGPSAGSPRVQVVSVPRGGSAREAVAGLTWKAPAAA
ncbi:MAG: hypothetical protein J3K34DRAFT_465487 [Monoraphidium minutum]|nr:MAG: hypothetical protein J3K34DRAFT_465487 [Monoraphidium minutum]